MKRMTKYYRLLAGALAVLLCPACESFLEEEVYTEYDPSKLLQTEEGINSVLVSAYGELQFKGNIREFNHTFAEFPTDIALESGGGFEREAILFVNYQWDDSHAFFSNSWSKMYRAIRNANSLLDNASAVTAIPEQRLAELIGEARFIRAAAYFHLYDLFGPVPLITTTETLDMEPARPTEAAFSEFLIAELREAANTLPSTQDLKGKATKGAALAYLCKFLLHTKRWDQVAEVTEEIISLNRYELFPAIEELFTVDNENNKEFIFVHPYLPLSGYGNTYMAHAFPPNYPVLPNWENYGAQYRTYTRFVKSFHPDDRRKLMFVNEYTDIQGRHILLLEDGAGKPLDNARSFKFVPDPAAIAAFHGNDCPIIRYADVLLSRAEALNELDGPVGEPLELLNQVRERAGVPLLTLEDLPTKDAFRDHLLQERAWEFFSEGLRRQDLIRHGKFIELAVQRGKQAMPHHVRYPIPRREMEANSNLTQNEGYE